jgi:hypothetical protein
MPAPRDRGYEQAIKDVQQQIRQAVDIINTEIERVAKVPDKRDALIRRAGRKESLLQLAATLEVLRDGE